MPLDVRDGVKTGKAQNEHMFSGVPPITDMRRWLCRYQTFYLKPFMRSKFAHVRFEGRSGLGLSEGVGLLMTPKPT